MFVKRVLLVMFLILTLAMFMGSASAASNSSLTWAEVENSSYAVQSFTESKGDIPSSVSVSGKKVTDNAYLEVLCKAVVKANTNDKTSVSVVGRGNAPAPSGTAKGTLTKSQYLTMANNIKSFYVSNNRAPNYAESSIGNIRYETLVYMYSKIMNYYRIHDALPSSISFMYVSGVSSSGAYVDATAPTVNGNIPWGTYNTPKTVTLTASDNADTTPTIYYRLNQGAWSSATKTVSLSMVKGRTYLDFYACDDSGNRAPTYSGYFTIDMDGPTVTASPTGSCDNASKLVSLIANDNFDTNPAIYYTLNGSDPSSSSLRYLNPLNITNGTILKFLAIDNMGNIGVTGCEIYRMDNPVVNINTGKSYLKIQDALDDVFTLNGNTIEVYSSKLLENVIINKNITLSVASENLVIIRAMNEALPIFTINSGGCGSTIQGFIASGSNNSQGVFLNSSNNCSIIDNTFTNFKYGLSFNNSNSNLILWNYLCKNQYGVFMNNSGDNDIDYNLIANNSYDGIHILNSYSSENRILKNDIMDNYQNGVYVFLSKVVILENMIVNNLQVGIKLDGLDAVMGNPNIFSGHQISDFVSIIKSNTIAGNYHGFYDKFFVDFSLNRIYSNVIGVVFDGLPRCPDMALNNNWWGSNSPVSICESASPPNYITISSAAGADIYSFGPLSYALDSFFASDIGFNSSQIINASVYVKNFIESNNRLPDYVNINGIQVSMPQFLRMSTRFVTNEYYGIDDTFILGDFGSVPNHIENITTDDLIDDEYINLAQEITAYMDITRTAPSYISNTSLGDSISFESLVYMYSKVLVGYNSNNQTLPDSVSIIPWIAVSNPNKVYNFRTQKLFNNIQSAIDDLDTRPDDTIFLGKGNYSENVIINKRININSFNGNVTVCALNPNLPIFTINALGNGSSIQNMLINGSISSMGVYINNSFNNTISHNVFTLNMNGIYLYNSRDNEISRNIIFNNTLNGISVYLGGNNTFSENNLTYNNNAILLNNTYETTICQNLISKNTIDGINSENSSADINFNMISQNGRYGLHNLGNSSLDALNNWWGSNNPMVSLNGSSDIYNSGGTLNYDKWIVMNINSSCDRSNRTSDCYNYIITVDLTHDNQGNDTSDEGNIPDGMPVNFVTNIGTIVSTGYTKDGKAKSYLNSKSQGFANISAMLDNQTNCTNVNVTSVNILSIYNNRTHEGFTTIQGAINDNDTINGDILTLADGNYIENVIVNKNVTVISLNGNFVTINAADSSLPVFNITGAGNGSTIKGLSIMGSDYFGIFLDSVNNCNIVENIFTKNSFGIYLNSANNNNLTNNKLIDNYYGIDLFNSKGNILSGNYLAENYYGIYFDNSNNNSIIGNILHKNWYGIQLSNSSYNNLLNNELDGHWLGAHIYVSNNTSIINNTIAENYVGISYYDSEVIFSLNNFTENEIADISQINSSEIVASENLYDCGPAALATLMKFMGLNVTVDELSLLAGTDYDGTSMYGLIQAANAKGLNATGVLLPVDQLVNNSLVILSNNGRNHYSIFRDCINNTVHLIDPSLGNIEMSYSEFCDLYGGKSVIFTNEIPLNGAIMDPNDLKNTKGSVVFLAVLAAPAAYSALTYVAAAAVGAAAGYLSYQAYKHYKNPPKKSHTHVNKYATVYSPKNVRHYPKKYRNPTKGGKNYNGDKNNKKNQEYERKKKEQQEKEFKKALNDAKKDPLAGDRLGRIPSSGKDPISKKYKIIAVSLIPATIGGFIAKDYLVYLYKKHVLDRTKSYIDIDRTKLIIDIDKTKS